MKKIIFICLMLICLCVSGCVHYHPYYGNYGIHHHKNYRHIPPPTIPPILRRHHP